MSQPHPPSVQTIVYTLAVPTTGAFLCLGQRGFPTHAPGSSSTQKVCAYSFGSRPDDANGDILVSTQRTGPTSGTDLLGDLALGTAIRLAAGEVLDSPASVPGPFDCQFAIAPVGAETTVRVVLHVVNV